MNQAVFTSVCDRIVANCLEKSGLKKRIRASKPGLSERHIQA